MPAMRISAKSSVMAAFQIWSARGPILGIGDVGAGQQAVGGAPADLPFGGAGEQPRVLADPCKVRLQGGDELGETRAEAGARRVGLELEIDIVALLELRRRARSLQLAAEHG